MQNRIKELLREREWSSEDLAQKIGAHPTTVSRLINDRLPLDEDWLIKLSRAFSVPPEDIIARPSRARMVTVIGVAQAGAWGTSWRLSEPDQYNVPIPDDRATRDLALSAVELRGPSMNRRYAEGTVIVFDPADRDPKAGKRYVIERRQGDGKVEATVRTAWLDGEGKPWFVTESDDPRFTEAIALRSRTARLRVLGRVRYAVQREPD